MLLRLVFILFPALLFAQDKMNVDLLDNWSNDNIPFGPAGIRYNECWGFVQNGEEYAVLGSSWGTHFFRITEDDTFEEISLVFGAFASPQVMHRDYKVYQNYLYAVCDEGSSSLQIIDLSTLPDSVSVVNEIFDEFTHVHNLFIDSANALLYSCSQMVIDMAMPVVKPLRVYSLNDPVNPQLVYPGDDPLPDVHDAYVRDNIAYLSCGFDGLRVYDFTNPASPVFLQNLNIYQDQGYNHQGWLTPDGTRFIFGDEDEGKKLKNCSVAANHQLTIENTFGSNWGDGSVPHNIMLSNEFAYVAYYNEGLRIYDIRTIVPEEIAWYDTYPEETIYSMVGAWGVYSDLPSGRIIVSDRTNGLFLFDFREDIFKIQTPASQAFIYPNPVEREGTVTIRLNMENYSDVTIEMVDLMGNEVLEEQVLENTYFELPVEVSQGTYLLNIIYLDYLGDFQQEVFRVCVQ